MNRNLFREYFDDQTECSVDEINALIDKCLPLDTPSEKRQIAMEEAAELAIECSKMNRNQGDIYGLLEEMADVFICLEYLQKLHGFTDQQILRAIAVKLKRYWNKHGSKGENKSET